MSKSKKETNLKLVKGSKDEGSKVSALSPREIVSELDKKPVEMLGHVTSSYYSPNLNKSIALAVVKNGKKLKGQKMFVPMKDKNISVTITDTVFLDKENKRLNA